MELPEGGNNRKFTFLLKEFSDLKDRLAALEKRSTSPLHIGPFRAVHRAMGWFDVINGEGRSIIPDKDVRGEIAKDMAERLANGTMTVEDVPAFMSQLPHGREANKTRNKHRLKDAA